MVAKLSTIRRKIRNGEKLGFSERARAVNKGLLPSKAKKRKMLKNRIIPCLDVKNGRVVKGINFVELKDAGDPVEQAKIYSDGGADEICFLDITASNENRDTIIDIIKKTAKECFVPLTVGGGVRTIQNITDLLLAGADKVSINTAAVKNSDFVKEASKNLDPNVLLLRLMQKKFQKTNGKFLHMAVEIEQVLTLFSLPKKWKQMGLVKFC